MPPNKNNRHSMPDNKQSRRKPIYYAGQGTLRQGRKNRAQIRFGRNGQRERRRFLSAKLGGCKRGNTERAKRHTMPDNKRKKKNAAEPIAQIKFGRNRRRKKIASGRRRNCQEYRTHGIVFRVKEERTSLLGREADWCLGSRG